MSRSFSCEHDDCIVVHDTFECPLCNAEEEIKELNSQIESLDERIAILEIEVEDE